MASMSYCRFRNTCIDLSYCTDDLNYHERLSPEEDAARIRLYQLAKEYIEAYENYTPREKEEDDEY